ncbi:hypothetical protein [Flavobacterium dankookense]|uniref:Uncharacterized protein n=1 Tax=Flavobacterium dankookense TaxID=706186 RepID=A0A4R6QD30_9FLAO|nr:hypothetical protein [Flavobacterium dankookense]TDP60351.1 hypothetical protein BC748_1337 [Flavobacterium dankookense]
MKKNLMIAAFMFSAVTFANTVEKENLSTNCQETEEVSCAYTSQYTWYRAEVKKVFTMAGVKDEIVLIPQSICTNCYSLGGSGSSSTVTTTCVNF